MTSDARVARLAGLFAVPPAVVVALILGIAAGPLAAVVAFVVVLAGLAAWALVAGDRLVDRALQRLGATPADPVARARLCNLVDGLSTSAGLTPPRIVVVDVPGMNALAAGARSGKDVVAVTTGLLDELELIELEAVIAELLAGIRRGDVAPATMVVATLGLGRGVAVPPDRDALADQGGVTLTRYPPGLAAALEKMESKGAGVPGQPATMAHLWLADPRSGASQDRGRLPLRERIEALREL